MRRLVQVVPPHANRSRKVAYVVYEGRVPGIYTVWYVSSSSAIPPLILSINRSEAEAQVTEVPGNVHQGFTSRLEAERAYVVAYAMGGVRSLPGRESNARESGPAVPIPPAMLDAFDTVSDRFLGAEWHVVFKGKAPGVYPAW